MHGHVVTLSKGGDDFVDKHLRGRGARCHADGMRALQRPPVNVGGARRKLGVGAAGAAATETSGAAGAGAVATDTSGAAGTCAAATETSGAAGGGATATETSGTVGVGAGGAPDDPGVASVAAKATSGT